jgi:TRAP-type C4-dicarboxylate transport system substrate-binding protein
MFSIPLTWALGAAVVSKHKFDQLTPEDQQLMLTEARALERTLNAQIRTDNQRALAGLQRMGLKMVEPPPDLLREFEAAAQRVMKKLDGSVWRRELRAQVEELLAEYRAKR